MEEHRGAWSAAGAAVMTLSGGGAVAWAIASSAKHSELSFWPVIPFALVALVGLHGMLAPLCGWPPWTSRDDPLRAVLELEADIEDLRHRVQDGFDATPPTYWRHLLASNVWEKHKNTVAKHNADIYKEVGDAYRAANDINERVSLDKIGRPIPHDEDRNWFMGKVDGEMAHASALLHDRAPRRA
jgi:hypothetical protein